MKLNLSKGFPPIDEYDIRKIGAEFYNMDEPISQHMSNLSAEMSDYENKSNNLLKWLDLFAFYHRAEKDSHLAVNIKKKIESSFLVEDRNEDDDGNLVDFIIRQITFERGLLQTHLFEIGNDYLKKYPEKKEGLFGFLGGHTNQKAAEAVLDAAQENLGRDSWIKLYLIYQTLPTEGGALSNNIRDLFVRYFHEPFETTVKELALNRYTQSDLNAIKTTSPAFNEIKDAEEQALRDQIEHLFPKKQYGLNIIEETGIFWANRSRYLRIVVTGGATICVPVAAGIFLTTNIYALISIGAALGGGLFVLEMVGHTGLKIEQVPDRFIDMLKGEFIALGLSAQQIKKAATIMSSQVKCLSDVAQKNQFQLDRLAGENKSLRTQVTMLKEANTIFLKNNQDHEKIVEQLNEILQDSGMILKQAESDIALENEKLAEENSQFRASLDTLETRLDELKEQNTDLKQHGKTLEDLISNLKAISQDSHESKEDLKKFTDLFKKIIAQANIQTTMNVLTEGENEYVKAAQNLYKEDIYNEHHEDPDERLNSSQVAATI